MTMAPARVRTVTGLPGDPPVVFEDPSAPHQIVITSPWAHEIAVSCTCLRPGPGRQAQPIDVRTRFADGTEAIAIWHDWHAGQGIEVTP